MVALFLTLSLLIGASLAEDTGCGEIQRIFAQLANSNNSSQTASSQQPSSSSSGVCRCYPAGKGRWIGCSGRQSSVNTVYRALNSLAPDTKVQQLWLWDSLLPSLPSDVFLKVRPNVLVVENSDLVRLRNGVFGPIRGGLEELQLKNNELKTESLHQVGGSVFADLLRLTRLDLSGNKLNRVDGVTFSRLEKLESLNLERNDVRAIDDGAFAKLSKLKRLNLAKNSLTKIEKTTFRGLESLEVLNLERNSISEIETGAFEHLTKLKVLKLSGNLLRRLRFTESPASLEQLYLNNNSISSLEDISLSSPRLKILSLDNNLLEIVPNRAFSRVSQLRVLSLAKNRIKTVEFEAFFGLSRLEGLTLQNNSIDALEMGTFRPAGQLRHLFLTRNSLSDVKKELFSGLKKLRILALSKNKLDRIDKHAFDDLESLEKLFLDGNRLEALTNGTLKPVETTLKVVDISANPLFCDCQLVWLANWMSQKDKARLMNVQMTRCQPRNIPLSSIEEKLDEVARACDYGSGTIADPGPSPSSPHRAWITGLGLTLALVSLAILLAIVCLYVQDAKMVDKGKQHLVKIYDGRRRMSSDMITLLPNGHGPAIREENMAERKVHFAEDA